MKFQRGASYPQNDYIRRTQDPSKNGNYNVFVMEIRMPKRARAIPEPVCRCDYAILSFFSTRERETREHLDPKYV